MSYKKRHFFDICGTLYRSNTTYDFLDFYLQKHSPVKYRKFRRCFSLPAKVLWKLMTALGMKKSIRRFLLGFLKGEPVLSVTETAKLFVRDYLSSRKVDATHRLLQKAEQDPEAALYLVSASILPVVEAIANDLQVSVYWGTTMEINDGFFTGNIVEDLESVKHIKLSEAQLLDDSKEMIVYTDGKEDRTLVSLANSVYIVEKKSERAYWKSLNPNASFHFLEL